MAKQYVKNLEVCPEFEDWLNEEDHPTWEAAWAACPYGDLMLFMVGLLCGPEGDPKRAPVILAACECAELVRDAEMGVDYHTRAAIAAAKDFAAGKADRHQVAHHAVLLDKPRGLDQLTVEGAAHYRWAIAVQYAVKVVYLEHSLHVAGSAASAATTAAECAYFRTLRRSGANAAETASDEILRKCADVVRRYFPIPPKID